MVLAAGSNALAQSSLIPGAPHYLITRVWGATIRQKLLNDADLALHGGSQEVLWLHGTLLGQDGAGLGHGDSRGSVPCFSRRDPQLLQPPSRTLHIQSPGALAVGWALGWLPAPPGACGAACEAL